MQKLMYLVLEMMWKCNSNAISFGVKIMPSWKLVFWFVPHYAARPLRIHLSLAHKSAKSINQLALTRLQLVCKR